MTKAFVETTVLTDVLLKGNSAHGRLAKQALARYDETQLPVYAIKEFKAGPLKNFAWFYNKLAATKSFARAVDALHGMALSPRRYTTATALEALREAAESVSQSQTLQSLVDRYGPAASPDAVLCDQFQSSIKVLIFKAWKQRRRVTSSVVHPLNCYPEFGPVEEQGQISLVPLTCDKSQTCCLAPELVSRSAEIEQLQLTSGTQPDKPENRNRSKALRAILRTPKRPFTDDMCRRLGGAYFALFAPADAVILTTNDRDVKPLASALDKSTDTTARSEG